MARSGKDQFVLTLVGVVILIGAAILWWLQIRDGVTNRGAALAVILTALGVISLKNAWSAKVTND
jgi:hypothetical protein